MPVQYERHLCADCGTRQSVLDAGACVGCMLCMQCCTCGARAPHRKRRSSEEMTWHGEPTGLFPRYCGVELECGLTIYRGSPTQRAVVAWNAEAVGDGSIELAGGVEIVSAPARGDDVEAQIRDLCGALARQGARVDKSCGYHCHVDARWIEPPATPVDGHSFTGYDAHGNPLRRVTYADLCRFARLLAKVESGLFNMVAPSRRKNRRYCAAWGSTFDRAGVFLAEADPDKERTLDCAIYGSVDAARSGKASGKYHGSRYKSVNLHSWHIHSTIEFRLHHGTVDADKVINWAAICVGIVHYAFTHSDAEIAALRGTPSEILDRIVPSPQVRAWMQKRREHFAVKRSRTGIAPRRRAAAPMAVPLPDVTAGIAPEASEV